jgi:hypothetical protein
VTDPVPHVTPFPEPTVLGRAPRRCVRPGCRRMPATTLRFDYAARILTVDPLAPRGVPGEYDLCAEHAARTTPPSGWTMRDRAPSPAPALEPSPPVGPARVHGADRLAAALSAVPRAVSEDAPDAAAVQADRQVDRMGEPSAPAVAVVPVVPAPSDPVAPASAAEQRSARLDALLRPSPSEARPPVASPASSSPLPPLGREHDAARPAGRTSPRPAPQSLRLAPDPTTTVWCADLLATPAAAPTVPPVTHTMLS